MPPATKRTNANLTADDFENLGMDMLRRKKDGSAHTRRRRFRATFGTSPIVCSTLWGMLHSSDCASSAKHLMWGLMMLQTHETEENISTKAGSVDEKTFREHSWA